MRTSVSTAKYRRLPHTSVVVVSIEVLPSAFLCPPLWPVKGRYVDLLLTLHAMTPLRRQLLER